jgi:hypothetical protein
LTLSEIARPVDKGGVGANNHTVRDLLNQHPDVFEMRTGESAIALGRSSKATLYGLSQTPDLVDSVGGSSGGGEGTKSTESPYKDSVDPSTPPSPEDLTESGARLTSITEAVATGLPDGWSDDDAQALIDRHPELAT